MDPNHPITVLLAANRTLIAIRACLLGKCFCTFRVETSGCEYDTFASAAERIPTVSITDEPPAEFREVIIESTGVVYSYGFAEIGERERFVGFGEHAEDLDTMFVCENGQCVCGHRCSIVAAHATNFVALT